MISEICSSVNRVCSTVVRTSIPPLSVRLIKTGGFPSFKRIPASSNSLCKTLKWASWNGSTMYNTMSDERITLRISRPLPFPSAAPLISPGRSRIWILAPLCSITPGIHVRVVKAYPAASDLASVTLLISVDFPTDGNPTKATVASPLFLTSKPLPPPLAFAWASAFSRAIFNLAIFAFKRPTWCSVALFFWVLSISVWMALICSSIVAIEHSPLMASGWAVHFKAYTCLLSTWRIHPWLIYGST